MFTFVWQSTKMSTIVRNRLAILFILMTWHSKALAQLPGIQMPEEMTSVSIPFEYLNRFIVIKTYIHGFLPSNFIFDTGAEHTIILKKELASFLNVEYSRSFTLLGSDLKTEIKAYLTKGIQYRFLNKEINIKGKQDMLVLDEDYLRLDEYTGVPIHGIIGADAFANYIVQIDYDKKVITLTLAQNFKDISLKGYDKVNTSFFRKRPYIFIQSVMKDSLKTQKMLLDCGANIGMVLYSKGLEGVDIPHIRIAGPLGAGLGGMLEGSLGRIHTLTLGKYVFSNVVSSFQVIPDSTNETIRFRDGLLGNDILDRFNLIINYINEEVYIKPSKNFKKPFDVDRSGLFLSASGYNLDKFEVFYVQPNSPASEAGIQIGDRLTKMGWLHSSFYSLEKINAQLRSKAGTKKKLTFQRGKEKIKVKLTLRDLI